MGLSSVNRFGCSWLVCAASLAETPRPGSTERRVTEETEFHRGAENKSIKRFTLEKPGSRARIMSTEDREAIEKRHRQDRDRLDKIRSAKRKVKSGVEVDTRHPSFYDSVIEMEARI